MTEHATPQELLRETPLFRTLDRRAQEALSAQVQVRRFKEGDLLLEAGSSGRTLLILLEGQADVYASDGSSRFRVARLEAGELIGEMSFFSPRASRTADVIGQKDGMLAVLPHEVYAALCQSNPHAAASLEKAVLTVLADRMEDTNDLMASLMDRYRSNGLQAALARLLRVFGLGGSS